MKLTARHGDPPSLKLRRGKHGDTGKGRMGEGEHGHGQVQRSSAFANAIRPAMADKTFNVQRDSQFEVQSSEIETVVIARSDEADEGDVAISVQ